MKIPKLLLFGLISIFLCCFNSLTFAATVYDDFNGSSIDTAKWELYESAEEVFSQSGGLLNASTPSNGVYGYLGTKKRFRGDFEITLDFRNFQTTATSSANNDPQISLEVSKYEDNGNNFIFIFRGWSENVGHNFFSNGKLDGSWQSGSSASATSQAGLLRITRTGSTITTYYYKDSSWTMLKSFTGAFTEDVVAQIGVYTGDDGNFSVSCDYIEYVGQLVGWAGSWLLLLLGD
ncbi:MAG: hypothetical protein JRH04_14900 [Deltaproteobacteria bacterium]|nr:hypothetical protein [Deltaproteobacteria bacterium]MBW2116076.1 hypothetical protein [Deltaproteobacteria bacterium]